MKNIIPVQTHNTHTLCFLPKITTITKIQNSPPPQLSTTTFKSQKPAHPDPGLCFYSPQQLTHTLTTNGGSNLFNKEQDLFQQQGRQSLSLFIVSTGAATSRGSEWAEAYKHASYDYWHNPVSRPYQEESASRFSRLHPWTKGADSTAKRTRSRDSELSQGQQ